MKHVTVLPATIVLGLCSLVVLAIPSWAADKDESDIEKRIDNSAKVLDEIMGTPDKGIPDKIMSDAKCIAIIPSMVKIAVGFGGSHGKGVATCRLDKGRWSAVAPVTITGGSFGLQLGGQAIDLVMLVMNDQQIQDRRRCIRGRGSGGPSCRRRHRLENESPSTDVFQKPWPVCRY